MIARRRLAGFAALVIVASACGPERAAPPPDESATLGGEVVARVGDEAIPGALVASVARVQSVSPKEAARSVIDDAVAASGARARGLDRREPTAWLLVAARARFTSDQLMSDAKRGGPPTEGEIKTLSDIYWREVDRPPAVRVIHVVAQRPVKPEDEPKAREVAEALRAAVSTAGDADAFEAKAKAVPHPAEVAVRVERLPTFTEAGWVTEGEGGRMDEAFSRPAFALGAPGDTSAIVETKFGWHVIRLLERIPEQRMPMEERAVAFANEAFAHRAHVAMKGLLERLRGAHPVTISPAAEQLMRSAMAEPGPGVEQSP